jgi:hypothetical protein
VEKDGSLTDIKVLRDIGYGTGKEAKSFNQSPRWNPGIQNGKPVRVIFSSDPNSNSGLMLEKGIKILEEIAQRAISSRGNFVFVVYLVLGLLIIFMKDFP